MKRYWLQLVSLGVAVFFIAAVIRFPAELALHLLRDRVPAALAWQDINGTVFNATVSGLMVEAAAGRRIMLEKLEIRTSALSLLLGRLVMDMRALTLEGEVTGKVALRRAGWAVTGVAGSLPLQDLAALAPELAGMGAAGLLAFTADTLSGRYKQLPDAGRINMTVEDVRLDLLYADGELGSYSMEIRSGGAARLEGRLETLDSNALLGIAGELHASQDGSKLQFTGRAWASPVAPEQVQSILPLLGVVENGSARIQWTAELQPPSG